jgi:radical SAM/Cys-rich protein
VVLSPGLSLLRRGNPLADPAAQRRTLASTPTSSTFEERLASCGLDPLRPTRIEILQVNVGKRCNQSCRHCHVDAAPDRREQMSAETLDACLDVLARHDVATLDITGGAPELHPLFRDAVTRARSLGRRVIDRCNLTILLVPGFEDLAEFLAAHKVAITASLPYYLPKQTDAQRGDGVFEKSVEALARLNALGYGAEGGDLVLNLITNPVGAFLPGPQASLEKDWKRELLRRHGIRFNRLFTIANMPISRFLEYLGETGNLESYLERLVQAFNPAAAEGVMCRNTLSVGWDGTLYDCDFNQMLEMPIAVGSGARLTIHDFKKESLERRAIAVGPHCFGCTAGAGSSCGGAVT